MDKSMLADLDSLPEADKQRMSVMIDQLQIRDRFLHSHPKNMIFFVIYALKSVRYLFFCFVK